jgi:hypothetical protein
MRTELTQSQQKDNCFFKMIVACVTIMLCTVSVCLTYYSTHTFYKSITNTEMIPRG